ncbi:hypothetical protein [Streptomyces sp. NBC_01187]|uniref:hypothetical protein n=1 Tax=Streptomyces sp. NBC_01187 TaxID=2903766 RepID=UPI00386B651C|nr:hypothetical protein OG220_41995 [Streptomyces sp. NBC_01187]
MRRFKRIVPAAIAALALAGSAVALAQASGSDTLSIKAKARVTTSTPSVSPTCEEFRGKCTPSGTFRSLTEAGTPSPKPGMPAPTDPAILSYELWDANYLPRPVRLRPDGKPFSREENAVLAWIDVHRETIVQEAAKWNISPQAIVAAIAWEAMENVQPFRHPIPAGSGLGRVQQRLARWATGPGKVHTDFPLVKQVEERGYLPRQGLAERESLLSSAKGSIKYIAAIMGAFSDVTDKDGHYNIRYDVPMLTQLFQGSDLQKWETRLGQLRAQKYPELRPENRMPEWAKRNQVFLNASVPQRPWKTDPTPHKPTPQPPPTPTPTPRTNPSPG